MTIGTAERAARPLADRLAVWSIEDAWVAVAALVPFVATALGSTPAGDLAYQVRAGDVMIRTHEVLRTDIFTYTVHGHAWLNQQWAAAVLLAILHRVGGWTAIAVARAVIDGATFRIVYLLALRRSGNRGLSARLTIAAFAVGAIFPGALAARAQMFALPLFALSLVIVCCRDEHPVRLWLLPAITLVWANLHGSFFLPATLLGCAIVGDAMAERRLDPRRAVIVAACLAAAGVGPFGPQVYPYVLSLRSNPVVATAVDEWRPLIPTIPAGLAFYAVLAGVALAGIRRRVPFPVPDLLSVLVLSLLAVAAGRGLVWWAIGLPPLLAGAVRRATNADSTTEPVPERAATALVAGLVALGILAGLHAATVGRDFVSDAPRGITRFLAERVDPSSRIFDGWWGSWFEYALPGRPMFVDARAELFPRSVWSDYFAVSAARPDWDAILSRWKVSIVVASPDHQGPLITAMRRSTAWHVMYCDADGCVLGRSM
jgi:hypothetical protein